MRIVTTLPSATETVAALDCEPVGVSHECDHPPNAADAPAVTRSRIDTSGSSGEIDRQVLETADTEGGVYDVDVETLADLEPDVIVTQGMCDVCAVDVAVIEDAVDRISAEPEIVPTDPHGVADVLDDLERIGRAIGREERARSVRADLESRLDAIRERTADADLAADECPRVAVFDWTDPVMVAGHWTAELVEWAGGEYGLADVGEASSPREWEEIREYDPELIVVGPCGFSLEQIARNGTDLTEREEWSELTAVREGRVWAMDGDHYLNRPGPRLVDTLEALAPIIQPELFDGPAADIAVPFDELEGLEALETEDEPIAPDSRAEIDSSP
jgi:iron complex transport system substrate-binding protein